MLLRLLVGVASVAIAVFFAVATAVPSAAWEASKPLPASPHPSHQLSDGLIPPWPQLHDHLVLEENKVIAGHAIEGTLVVMNMGKRSIELNAVCGVKYAVALKSATYTPSVAFASTCTLRRFLLRPGRNTLKVKVSTTYLECTKTSSQAKATRPSCTSSGLPPLPPGSYTTVLEGTALALPQPRSITVTLMR